MQEFCHIYNTEIIFNKYSMYDHWSQLSAFTPWIRKEEFQKSKYQIRNQVQTINYALIKQQFKIAAKQMNINPNVYKKLVKFPSNNNFRQS